MLLKLGGWGWSK